MDKETELLSDSPADTEKAAEMIKKGGIVGMPTETVYGLAADALNTDAVAGIFRAKGRPADNPLIVHIADISDLERYARDIPEAAYGLAEIFWPGPMTMVLKKADCIPDITSGGLDTAGIRFPAHKAAQALIKASGTALAAPSANISGSPSPTTARHVMNDMNGRIDAVIDGGTCSVGVESTVLCFEGNTVKILRPGFVSAEDIAQAGFEVTLAKGITEEISEGEKVLSPGMKYKHYSPKAEVIMLNGTSDKFTEYVKSHSAGKKVFSLIPDRDIPSFPYECIPFGDTPEDNAHILFGALREADELGAELVFVRTPEKKGVGLAVYNRLLRAAAFREIYL